MKNLFSILFAICSALSLQGAGLVSGTLSPAATSSGSGVTNNYYYTNNVFVTNASFYTNSTYYTNNTYYTNTIVSTNTTSTNIIDYTTLAFTTIYTNNTTSNLLIIASVSMKIGSGGTSANVPDVQFELDSASDGTFEFTSQYHPESTNYTDIADIVSIVQAIPPGGRYRFVNNSAGTATAAIMTSQRVYSSGGGGGSSGSEFTWTRSSFDFATNTTYSTTSNIFVSQTFQCTVKDLSASVTLFNMSDTTEICRFYLSVTPQVTTNVQYVTVSGFIKAGESYRFTVAGVVQPIANQGFIYSFSGGGSGSGSQTPWLSDINANGYSVTNGGSMSFTNAYLVNLYATNIILPTNVFAGTTIDMSSGGMNAISNLTADLTITGITGSSAGKMRGIWFVGSGANRTLTYSGPCFSAVDGLKTWTVTNAQPRYFVIQDLGQFTNITVYPSF